MRKMKESKEKYEKISIPKELDETVQNAIRKSEKFRKKNVEIAVKKKRKEVWRWGVGIAAALVVATTIGVNTSEVFAMQMQNIPVVGSLVKVLTIRSYEKKDENINISVQVPGIETIENDTPNLSKEVNDEISNLCEAYASESLKRAEEYKKAFLSTGGSKEEWEEHKINIKVGYEIKSQTEEYLSFMVQGTESWVSAYAETKYYNLDLNSNSYLTLKDVLGDDYIEIANNSINSQIEQRETALGESFWSKESGGFVTINQDTKFFMNEKGNPVIVFGEYEIAPGYMGSVEFEVEK